jgi:ectoine hydroxylase-related dioxygenase (phytanoyl-CoA dioxygenase family)
MDIRRRFVLEDHLTPEQHQFFSEFGFIHFKRFITEEEVQQLLAAIKEVEQDWIKKDITKVNGIPIRFGKDVDGSTIVQRFAFASMHSDVLHEFLQDPRLQVLRGFSSKKSRIVEDEKDGLVINHYINDGKSNYTKLGWHTDSLRDIFQGFHMSPMINVGISLDDSPKEKGGLRILPRSHKQTQFELLFKKRYFVDNTPDKDEFALETESGDLTVHHGRVWHRVALATIEGEASRRRVMYFPIISGKYKPKSEKSRTPIYHKLSRMVR